MSVAGTRVRMKVPRIFVRAWIHYVVRSDFRLFFVGFRGFCLHSNSLSSSTRGVLDRIPITFYLTTVSPVVDSWYDIIVPFPCARVQSHFTVHEKGGRVAGERVSRVCWCGLGRLRGTRR